MQTDSTTEYYAACSKEYDVIAGYTEAEAELLRNPIKTRYQSLFKDKNVLEIACGTGYWTGVIAQTASSILATDIHPEMINLAKKRCQHLKNVEFLVSDAFCLDNVPGTFSAAFANWWWSHVPRERLAGFLGMLHSKLLPGSLVLFIDQLKYDHDFRRLDKNGNILEKRTLADGRQFEIVKNFPTEEEIHSELKGIARNIQYAVRRDEKSWSVLYYTL